MTSFLVDVAKILGAIAAIIIATGVLHKCGLGVYRTARRIEDTFDLVKKELTPNGGGSLHDAIRRIDHRVEVLEAIDQRTHTRRENDHYS